MVVEVKEVAKVPMIAYIRPETIPLLTIIKVAMEELGPLEDQVCKDQSIVPA